MKQLEILVIQHLSAYPLNFNSIVNSNTIVMKNSIIILSILLFAQIGFSQAPPQGINYQAVVYSDNGNNQPGLNVPGQLLLKKSIRVRFTIIANATNGNEVYKESHATTTDAFGMFSLVIGQGTQESSSSFQNINWGAGNHFLKVEIDKSGGTNYITLSNQQLWSVPYALYSGKSGSSDNATNSAHADSSDYSDLAGNGITGVTDNGNGTLTFNYLDGSSYTTGPLTGLGVLGPQGPQGVQGPAGQNGTNGQSAYDIWLAQGNTGTQQDFLNSLQGGQGTNGQNGLSAYEIWLSQGNTGSEQDFLTSLQANSNNTIFDPLVQIPDSVLLLLQNTTYTVPQGKFVKISCPIFNSDTPGYGARVKINGTDIYLSQGGYYSSWNTQENETEKYFAVQNEILLPEGTVIELLSEPRFLSVQEFSNNSNNSIKLVTNAQTVPLGKKWKIITSLISQSIITVSSYEFKLNGISLLAGYGKNCNGCSPPDRFYRSYLNGLIWLPQNTIIEPSTGIYGFVVIEY